MSAPSRSRRSQLSARARRSHTGSSGGAGACVASLFSKNTASAPSQQGVLSVSPCFPQPGAGSPRSVSVTGWPPVLTAWPTVTTRRSGLGAAPTCRCAASSVTMCVRPPRCAASSDHMRHAPQFGRLPIRDTVLLLGLFPGSRTRACPRFQGQHGLDPCRRAVEGSKAPGVRLTQDECCCFGPEAKTGQ